jgi:hypothetical protein
VRGEASEYAGSSKPLPRARSRSPITEDELDLRPGLHVVELRSAAGVLAVAPFLIGNDDEDERAPSPPAPPRPAPPSPPPPPPAAAAPLDALEVQPGTVTGGETATGTALLIAAALANRSRRRGLELGRRRPREGRRRGRTDERDVDGDDERGLRNEVRRAPGLLRWRHPHRNADGAGALPTFDPSLDAKLDQKADELSVSGSGWDPCGNPVTLRYCSASRTGASSSHLCLLEASWATAYVGGRRAARVVLTDSSGHYRMRLPAGVYTVVAEDRLRPYCNFFTRLACAVRLTPGRLLHHDMRVDHSIV